MAYGRLEKYYKEYVLLSRHCWGDPDMTISEHVLLSKKVDDETVKIVSFGTFCFCAEE